MLTWALLAAGAPYGLTLTALRSRSSGTRMSQFAMSRLNGKHNTQALQYPPPPSSSVLCPVERALGSLHNVCGEYITIRITSMVPQTAETLL